MIKAPTNLFPGVAYIANGDNGVAIDASAERGAYIVKMPAGGSLQAFSAYSTGGSGSRNFSIECFSVLNNMPDTDYGSSYDETSYDPGSYSASIATFDNALTVTKDQLVAFVATNLSGTPASNYASMTHHMSGQGCCQKTLHYDGTKWREVGGTWLNVKIGGVWYGSKCVRQQRNQLTSQPLYNDTGSPNTIRRTGFVYKPPADCVVIEVVFWYLKTGTVTGDWIKGEIWQGDSLIATSITMIPTDIITQTSYANAQPLPLAFNEVSLAAGTEYRIVARLDGAGALDSSNYITLVGDTGPGSTEWPSDDNTVDGYLGGTHTTTETPVVASWTDYRTYTASPVLPHVFINGYLLNIVSTCPTSSPSLISPINIPSTTNDISLNASTIAARYYFKAPYSGGLHGVRFMCNGNAGSVAASDIQINLYAVDANREKTGSSLASGTISSVNYGVRYSNFGTPYSIVKDTWYVVEITNTNATPASNYIGTTVKSVAAESALICYGETYNSSGPVRRVFYSLGATEFSLKKSDGTYVERTFACFSNNLGYAYTSYYFYNSTTSRRRVGNRFQLNRKFTLAAAQVGISTQGSTATDLNALVELFDSSNNLLGSKEVWFKNAHYGEYYMVYFDTPIDISPDATYYLVVRGNSTFGTAWNNAGTIATMNLGTPADPQSGTILKSGNGVTNTSSDGNPSTWTDISGVVLHMGLFGYEATYSGSGLLVGPSALVSL